MIEIDGEMVFVDEIVDRWVSASIDPTAYPSQYWKIRISDREYLVMYNTLFDSWWIKECNK